MHSTFMNINPFALKRLQRFANQEQFEFILFLVLLAYKLHSHIGLILSLNMPLGETFYGTQIQTYVIAIKH